MENVEDYIFKFDKGTIGKEYCIRFLPNMRDKSKNIVSYKRFYKLYTNKYEYGNISWVNINGELKILIYNENIKRKMVDELFDLSSNKYLSLTVIENNKAASLTGIEILEDKQYVYDECDVHSLEIDQSLLEFNLDDVLRIVMEVQAENIGGIGLKMRDIYLKENGYECLSSENYLPIISTNVELNYVMDSSFRCKISQNSKLNDSRYIMYINFGTRDNEESIKEYNRFMEIKPTSFTYRKLDAEGKVIKVVIIPYISLIVERTSIKDLSLLIVEIKFEGNPVVDWINNHEKYLNLLEE